MTEENETSKERKGRAKATPMTTNQPSTITTHSNITTHNNKKRKE